MNIAIDMGGTNTRIGFTNDSQNFDSIEKFKTPKSQIETQEKIKEALEKFDKPINKIVLGIAGKIDYKNQIAVSAPHIKWINNLTPQAITGIDNPNIQIFNDAELAGLAESYAPYASDYENIAYITISTGVGGTMVRNKKADTHHFNYEPGHIVIDKSSVNNDPIDGVKGSFESLCSGTAFLKEYRVQPRDCEDEDIWTKYGEDLATGLYSLTILWQPEVIVLGGSMTKKWDSFYDSLYKTYHSYKAYFPHAKIVKSELGDLNGLTGGLKILSS